LRHDPLGRIDHGAIAVDEFFFAGLEYFAFAAGQCFLKVKQGL
jgi:hypothetical protein